MIEKHLYQRTLTDSKTGKPFKAWCFWYYHDGKKVRKSCGQYCRPCLLKRDAQAYIARLDDSLPENNSPQVTLYDLLMECMMSMVTTGMRSGEIRALQVEQFTGKDGILINRMRRECVEHLKCGNADNPKWRIAILPARTKKGREVASNSFTKIWFYLRI